MRTIFLILLGSLIVSNTFSPQFLIWLAPFVAFLSYLEAGMFIGASSLTWLYFRYWDDLINLTPLATSVLIARNVLLVLLFLVSVYKLIKLRNGKKNQFRKRGI